LAATPQQPGWSPTSILYNTNVSASGNAAVAREVTLSVEECNADDKGENDRSLILSDIKPDRSTRYQLSDRIPASTANWSKADF
jgi:hypothetical protein